MNNHGSTHVCMFLTLRCSRDRAFFGKYSPNKFHTFMGTSPRYVKWNDWHLSNIPLVEGLTWIFIAERRKVYQTLYMDTIVLHICVFEQIATFFLKMQSPITIFIRQNSNIQSQMHIAIKLSHGKCIWETKRRSISYRQVAWHQPDSCELNPTILPGIV